MFANAALCMPSAIAVGELGHWWRILRKYKKTTSDVMVIVLCVLIVYCVVLFFMFCSVCSYCFLFCSV